MMLSRKGRIATSGLLCLALLLVPSGPALAHDNGNGDKPTQGCTPGYWKNHVESWVGFATGQTLEDVFDVPNALGLDSVTLLDALSFGGGSGVGGAARILFRAAVAGVLNAAHPDVAYDSVGAVVNLANAALASGSRSEMLAVAAQLDTANNLGCPLN